MSGGGTWASLPDLIVEDAERLLFSSFGLTFFAALALISAPWWLQVEPLRIATGVLFIVIALLVWRRISWLRHLLRVGVEVKAVLSTVDEEYGETDFRWATYRYEYAGRTYDHTISGTDFFMAFATRHGNAVILLIDPERPAACVFVRSAPTAP